jgi:hypothetical protein
MAQASFSAVNSYEQLLIAWFGFAPRSSYSYGVKFSFANKSKRPEAELNTCGLSCPTDEP